MTACGHLSQTLDGLDGARKENGGRGMEEPRASIPLDYRFLHLSFYRYKRKRKGDAEKMEAVVRGTKTIEEFKRVREDMLKRAERYSRKHIASCENWQEGLPVKCWKGEFGAMWIEYESGNCWQYRETASGLEWH